MISLKRILPALLMMALLIPVPGMAAASGTGTGGAGFLSDRTRPMCSGIMDTTWIWGWGDFRSIGACGKNEFFMDALIIVGCEMWEYICRFP